MPLPEQDTRNIINTARDLLVGKVPMPVDQCQEITRALIYKFLSAADVDAITLGGQPAYFVGADDGCRWEALLLPEQTANEIHRRYTAGLAMLGRRADIPPVFQTIYQDAYLPYNDPIILRDFLRTIDRFDTDDTEKIGDAYELLLQDLGAQASAGQFRTPRHIIDFIVGIVNPQRHETILDPACGTGGFLASAWQHINRAGGLTAADRSALAGNLVGYDIAPDMARLATVNLYLNHRQSPNISVYDTLTSEKRWNDHYDVILANPPFMSPKGGIRPHRRFFTGSKRSEVLFVDYIIGHLNEGGRAGVIVPEGVIFQSQRAHTQLRKMLVEGYLVAVVSLPAGVFQPYSGVKTSILIMDQALAQRADGIAFFKVANDGYDLGAQRRPVAANDLPTVAAELGEYLRRRRDGEPLDDFAPTRGQVVAKARIAEGGEYNLSGERYKAVIGGPSQYQMVKLGEPGLFEIVSGGTPDSRTAAYWGGNIPWITLVDLPPDNFITEIKSTERAITDAGLANSSAKMIPAGSIVVSSRATIGRIGITRIPLATNQGFKNIIIKDKTRAIPEYIAHALTKLVPMMESEASGATFKEITKTKFAALQIPLPPMEVQRELVMEIEGYQRVIDGARMMIEAYRPHIDTNNEWPLVVLNQIAILESGSRQKGGAVDSGIPSIGGEQIAADGSIKFDKMKFVSKEHFNRMTKGILKTGDVLLVKDGATTGKTGYFPYDMPAAVNEHVFIIRAKDTVLPYYLYISIKSDAFQGLLRPYVKGIIGGISREIGSIAIPLPPIEVQRDIVTEIEGYQRVIDGAHILARRMEGRIAAAVGRAWSDGGQKPQVI